ncbi:neutral zinc metallopeptidase [Allonocardiopsis opalescens]|uniref:Metalloprotease n=1 Tax=Allonocardiopsis opalescens TaxID=1144618 RepID=A0A2T0QAR2_9ACTN|nr:neutral zinc metallopeptidase [Allonocardiopsis opalescens]PRY00900.1 hypothetical protein CLV72_102532 [Allonocardiopsis opalescens]
MRATVPALAAAATLALAGCGAGAALPGAGPAGAAAEAEDQGFVIVTDPLGNPGDGSGLPDLADTAPTEASGEPVPGAGTVPADAGADPQQELFHAEVMWIHQAADQFWRQNFEAGGYEWTPIEMLYAYEGETGPTCAGEPSVPENAYYCIPEHYIAYDDPWMRAMYDRLGDAVVWVIIPHEYGHAAQHQLSLSVPSGQRTEQQADCYAGAFLDHVLSTGMAQAELGDEEEIAALFSEIADPEDQWWDPQIHGTVQQRQGQFLLGYNSGWETC